MEVADAAVDGPQDATFTLSHDQDCDVFGELNLNLIVSDVIGALCS